MEAELRARAVLDEKLVKTVKSFILESQWDTICWPRSFTSGVRRYTRECNVCWCCHHETPDALVWDQGGIYNYLSLSFLLLWDEIRNMYKRLQYHWGSHQNQIFCSLTLISGGFKAIWDLQIDTLVSLQGAVWINLENTANDLSVMATPAMIRTCPIPRRLIARSYKTYTHKWNEKICKKLPRYWPGP